MTNSKKNPRIGQMVTIWPRLSSYESRDTEPGAQPWQAVCVGYTVDKIIIQTAMQGLTAEEVQTKYNIPEFRGVERELVRF